MYQKELNERNPLRVFEHSIHGGLGLGNLGVIVARHGTGKTALLVGIANQLLPLAERNPQRIAAWLSERAGRPADLLLDDCAVILHRRRS